MTYNQFIDNCKIVVYTRSGHTVVQSLKVHENGNLMVLHHGTEDPDIYEISGDNVFTYWMLADRPAPTMDAIMDYFNRRWEEWKKPKRNSEL